MRPRLRQPVRSTPGVPAVRLLILALLLGGGSPTALAQVPASDSLAADGPGLALAGPVVERWLSEDRPRRAEALERARRARLDSLRPPEQRGMEAFSLKHEDAIAADPCAGVRLERVPRRFRPRPRGVGAAAATLWVVAPALFVRFGWARSSSREASLSVSAGAQSP